MPALFIREPVNALTHLAAMFAAIPATAFLLRMAGGDRVKFYGMLIYSVVSFSAYAGSGLFHAVPEEYTKPFALLDHIGIYALIAGTVTPIGLIVLHGRWRVVLRERHLVIGGGRASACGCARDPPLAVRTAFYLVMGWIGCSMYFQMVPAAARTPRWCRCGSAACSTASARRSICWVAFPPEFSQNVFSRTRCFTSSSSPAALATIIS